MTKKLIAVLAGSLMIFGCRGPQEKNAVEQTQTDTVETTVPVDAVPVSYSFDRQYNDLAKFLAGIKQDSGSASEDLNKLQAWKDYSARINDSWERFRFGRLKKIRNWTDNELKTVNAEAQTIFYPFSGPDFLNVYSFFPNAKKYIMIGLEPVGLVPDVKKVPQDSLPKYFQAVQQSLFSILNLSFFKTIDMAEDFKSEQLDGITADLMIFIARTGNKVINLQPIRINENGSVIKGDFVSAANQDKQKVYGVEINFQPENSDEIKTLYYFSADLWDRSLQANTGFLKFLSQQNNVSTYLKSASYLMHKDYFSVVRKIILQQSQYVLQDDSGIPFHFFADGNWEARLYGTYNKPIKLFKDWYQEDLKKAYSDSLKPLPLNFGIGYNFQVNESNLMLFKRKENPTLKTKI